MLLAAIAHKLNTAEVPTTEDALTSTVFGRLQYLPVELFQRVLANATGLRLNVGEIGTLEHLELWPNWDSTDTSNSRFVEPDVFMRFSGEVDLIIEAKRYDWRQQYLAQWENQMQAYRNLYGEEKRRVLYLALGGLRTPEYETMSGNQVVHKCYWRHLVKEIGDMLAQIAESYLSLDEQRRVSTILEDVLNGCALFGYYLPVNVDGMLVGLTIDDTATSTLEVWKTLPAKS